MPAVTGGGKRSCADSRFVRVSTMLANVKQSLAGTCHALDGKRLPRYLAEFRYRFNRRYDPEALVPRLLHASVRTPPVPYRLLALAEFVGNQVRHCWLAENASWVIPIQPVVNMLRDDPLRRSQPIDGA